MTGRIPAWCAAIIVMVGLLEGRPDVMYAQSPASATTAKTPNTPPTSKPKGFTAKYVVPRTPWGDPDFQGIWNNGTITPLQRPKNLTDRQTLTDEERAELDEAARTRDDKPPRPGDTGFYNAIWWDPGPSLNRTSLIIDPPNGMLPPMTAEGQQRQAERQAARRTRGEADSWEDRPLWERCIIYRPLPRIPTTYNNNYQFVQAPGYVSILQEEIHEARVIPLNGGSHIGQNIRQWLGDSRGHWDGDTLVVETTNFTDKTDFQGSGANLHVVERFKRAAPDVMEYEFTVSDPTTWTRPWTAAWPWMKTDGPVLEYACHEGNYGLEGILSGARADEKKAAAAAKK